MLIVMPVEPTGQTAGFSQREIDGYIVQLYQPSRFYGALCFQVGGKIFGVVSFDVYKTVLIEKYRKRRGRASRNPMLRFDEESLHKLFGELLTNLNLPTEPRGAFPRVVDLYYVIYAFQTVLSHPALGDQQTTFEFIG